MTSRLLEALARIGLSCALLTVPAAAESLASTRMQALPSITSDEALAGLLAIDGRLVAIGPSTTWLLDADGQRWSRSPWHADAPVHGVAGNGHDAFVLLGSDAAVTRIDRVALVDDRLSGDVTTPLPTALSAARGTILKDLLVVVGMDGNGNAQMLQRPLASSPSSWTAIPTWPGAGTPTSIVAQTGAVFITVSVGGQADRILRWSADQGWTARGTVPGTIVAGSGRALGQASILYLVRGTQPAATSMTFHTITGSWATLPGDAVDGATATAPWTNGLAWARGDVKAGHIALGTVEVQAGRQLLRWLDWVVIVAYLAAMLGIGLYFYLREKRSSTSDFFVGGRSIPFWAAGVSLYVANTSSISYIAIPAKAFETNWQYMTNNLIAVVGLMFVAVWIVPLLRRLDLMSVFQYLEIRFHPAIRMLASGLFIAVQIGSRMSVILFLPALAIATITGIDVVWSVLIMGGFTIVYTAMGGMKAVIWTDFVQLFVKMGGALFAIGFIVWKLDGGVLEFLATARAEDKTRLFDFSFDLTKATVWGFVFLVIFDVVLTFPKDQVLMQRTLSTSSDKEAGRSIWAMAALMIPGGFIFYTIGTALFVFYKTHPERINPLLTIDATFPLFIAAELPMGVTGLIIAGILAAAMATLSSIMNSVATLASVDFYEKLIKKPDPKKSVRFAEAMTIVAGLFGIGAALLLSRFDIHSLFDVSIELAGLLGGGFAGAYTLGMFTRRANSPGVAIGVASSIVLTTIAWSMHLVHPYFYLAISILLCIVIGYAASLLFPPPKRSLNGLTIHADRSAALASEGASTAAR